MRLPRNIPSCILQIVTEDGLMRPVLAAKRGGLYSGGSAHMVEKALGVSPPAGERRGVCTEPCRSSVAARPATQAACTGRPTPVRAAAHARTCDVASR